MIHTDNNLPSNPQNYFGAEEIIANRQGTLTTDQFNFVESVYKTTHKMAWQGCQISMFWIPLLLIIIFAINENITSGKGGYVASVFFFLLLLGSIVFLPGLTIFTILKARDVRDKRISMAEGEVRISRKTARTRGLNYKGYELRLGNRLFLQFANHASIAHFEDGKTYRVYYIKYYPFPLMLSAEEV